MIEARYSDVFATVADLSPDLVSGAWGEDMREQMRRIERADREARIVGWIVLGLAFPVLVVRRLVRRGW